MSYFIGKKNFDEEDSGLVKRMFIFSVHPRTNLLELLWLLFLTPSYGFLLTYKMDWGMFYMSIFSSYSMLGEPVPEITPYLTNQDFHLFSNHYQRVYYQIILALIGLAGPVPVFVPVIVTVFQAVGLLGNPFVTILYSFEQIQIFMGGSSRASDSRIIYSAASLVGLYIASYYIKKWPVTICFGYIFSNDIWLGFGLIQPFTVANEKMI